MIDNNTNKKCGNDCDNNDNKIKTKACLKVINVMKNTMHSCFSRTAKDNADYKLIFISEFLI